MFQKLYTNFSSTLRRGFKYAEYGWEENASEEFTATINDSIGMKLYIKRIISVIMKKQIKKILFPFEMEMRFFSKMGLISV